MLGLNQQNADLKTITHAIIVFTFAHK